MADQWEFCVLRRFTIEIYTGKNVKYYKVDAYIEKHLEFIKTGLNAVNLQERLICVFLANGWEPLTPKDDNYYFKRKFALKEKTEELA